MLTRAVIERSITVLGTGNIGIDGGWGMPLEPLDIRERLRRRQAGADEAPATVAEPAPSLAPPAAKGGKPKGEINKRMLILALATAAMASFLIVNYVRSSAGVLAERAKLVKVPVLAQDVVGRTVITDKMITYKEIPALYVVDGTAKADETLVGKVALTDLYKGEPVLSKRVSEPNAATGVAVKIPVGHRAMAVDNQLQGLLKPGDYVDVYATVTDTKGKSHTEPVLQHSQVLAVGNRISATGDEQQADTGKATLAVADSKVHLMTLMEGKGNFRLVLRAPDDTSTVASKFTDQQLLALLTEPAEAPKPPPAKPAPVQQVVREVPVYRQVVRQAPPPKPAPPKPAPPKKDPVVVTIINGGNVEQQTK